MLKVLHITTDFFPGTGGLERFVRDLAVWSRKADLDPSVLALNRIAGGAERLAAHAVVDGIPVQRVGFFDLKYYKPTALPIDILKQADVLHVHGLGAPLDFVAFSRPFHHRPVVLSTHGGIFHTENAAFAKEIYFRFVRRFVLPQVDQVVACGGADAELFAQHGFTDLITIDNGIDLAPFASTGAERVPNRLVFVGRIAPNKAIDHLIQVLARVRREGTAATLRIIGPDRYRLSEGLRRLAADLGITDAVSFAGEVGEAQLPVEYHQADLFVSASRHEGFGISAVEAMASGAIPLLNDIPAFGYLLNGDAASTPGVLTDFSDYTASARAVLELLGRDREPLRELARRRAANFSWQELIPRWRRLYDSLSCR